MKGESGEVVTLYWPSFPSSWVAGCQHEVGGSLDSGELAGVVMSKVEQLGRSGGGAEVALGSGTGAGQSRWPALSAGLLRSATDLSEGSDDSGPLSGGGGCLLPGEMEGLRLMAFEALSSWAGSRRASEG